MMLSRGSSRPHFFRALAAVLAALACLSLAGCSSPLSLPTSGAITVFPASRRRTSRVYTNPSGPVHGASPEGIFRGFLQAAYSGVQRGNYSVAHEFLASSSRTGWRPSGALIYNGKLSLRRRSQSMRGSLPNDGDEVFIDVKASVTGRIDAHGVYSPFASARTLTFRFVQSSGEWRILRPDRQLLVSENDFPSLYHARNVYFLSDMSNELVPDRRWFAVGSWRSDAVRALLAGPAAWLGEAVGPIPWKTVRLARPVKHESTQGTSVVTVSNAALRLGTAQLSLLVRLIRAGIGSSAADGRISVRSESGTDLSAAGDHFSIQTHDPLATAYTLSNSAIVLLSESSPLRIGRNPDLSGVRQFAFSPAGGAAVKPNGTVECLTKDVASCGTLFDGRMVRSLGAMYGDETWGVLSTGRSLVFARLHSKDSARSGIDTTVSVPWLNDDESIVSATISPEGSRMLLVVSSSAGQERVVMSGIVRSAGGTPVSLARSSALIWQSQPPRREPIIAATFVTDTRIAFIVHTQKEDVLRYAEAPGPSRSRRVPGRTLGLTSGMVAGARSVVHLGTNNQALALPSSMRGMWSYADIQVSAVANCW